MNQRYTIIWGKWHSSDSCLMNHTTHMTVEESSNPYDAVDQVVAREEISMSDVKFVFAGQCDLIEGKWRIQPVLADMSEHTLIGGPEHGKKRSTSFFDRSTGLTFTCDEIDEKGRYTTQSNRYYMKSMLINLFHPNPFGVESDEDEDEGSPEHIAFRYVFVHEGLTNESAFELFFKSFYGPGW